MAACVHCGQSLPRGAAACPACGTAVARAVKRAPAAPPAARPAGKAITPVVKAVATPVTPSVKGGADPLTPTLKAAPKPVAKPAPKAAAKPANAADGAKPAKAAARKAAEAAPPAAPEPPARRGQAADAGDDWAPFSWEAAAPAERATAPASAPAPPVWPDPPAPATPAVPVLTLRPYAAETVGEADERHPHEPVAAPARPRPGIFTQLFEEPPEGTRRPFPLRFVRGDWRPALLTALPAFGVLLVLAALAVTALVTAERPDGEALAGGTSAGRWLRYVAAAVGLTYGSSLDVKGTYAGTDDEFGFVPEDFGVTYAIRFVPLTLTLLALAALWFAARFAAQRNVTPDRAADAARVAVLYGAGVAAVASFARWTLGEVPFPLLEAVELDISLAMAPWKALFWSSAAAFSVTWLATGRFVVTARWARWALAVRGAAAGLAAGVAASFLLLVALAYAKGSEVDAGTAEVTSAVPLAAGFGVDLGVAAFGVVSGGQFRVPYVDERHTWSLWASWMPKPYLALLLVPALAVAVGTLAVFRRTGAPPREAARAAALMGLPAALLWLVLAAAGTARMEQSSSFGFGGALTSGAVLWDALLVGLWFGAGGWLAGQLLVRVLARRAAPAAPVDQPEQAPVP